MSDSVKMCKALKKLQEMLRGRIQENGDIKSFPEGDFQFMHVLPLRQQICDRVCAWR